MLCKNLPAVTPLLKVDKRIVKNNVERFQEHCYLHNLKLRPHIKTHKITGFAHMQTKAGAVGITCQKLSEAEEFAEHNCENIFITYNIVGKDKLRRLRAIRTRRFVEYIGVSADHPTVVQGLAEAYESSEHLLMVRVECDTGDKRCGVQTPAEAAELAKRIHELPNLEFEGLMTYPATNNERNTVEFLREAKTLIEESGIPCPEVSTGGSPEMWNAQSYDGLVTEYRAGTYIYNDRSLLVRGTCSLEDCAARVIATVVSTPTENRVIIDAGSKALTTDLLGFEDYGHIIDHPNARITRLSEEHGIVECTPEDNFKIGDCISIIPNHICVVSNLFDCAWVIDGSKWTELTHIDARGKVT